MSARSVDISVAPVPRAPRMRTVPQFPGAPQPDIVRSAQKDEYYGKQLKQQFVQTVTKIIGQRLAARYQTELETIGDLVFHLLTTGIGNSTLGEEYCDIVQVQSDTRLPLPLLRRIALVFLSHGIPYVFDRFARKLQAQPHLHSGQQQEPQSQRMAFFMDPLRKIAPHLKQVSAALLKVNLLLFYFYGVYYHVSKRVTGTKYIVNRGQADSKIHYFPLGLLMAIQMIATGYMLVKAKLSNTTSLSTLTTDTATAETTTDDSTPVDEDSLKKCALCLCPRTSPSVTPCGHVFCWSCVAEWCNSKHNVFRKRQLASEIQTMCPTMFRLLPRSPSEAVAFLNSVPLFKKSPVEDVEMAATCGKTSSTEQSEEFAPFPQPKQHFLLGNVREIDPLLPVISLMRLANTYGPLYRLSMPGGRNVLVFSSQKLTDEICDDRKFDKKLSAVLVQVRDFAGDGLFTAHTEERGWGIAHRVLVPVFGPVGMRGMFDGMLDIADQLVQRWERFGESNVIDVADNFTRLTLDTIALCAFTYRFNSFYRDDMHPFVNAMVDCLQEAGARTRRLAIQTKLMMLSNRRYNRHVAYMNEVSDELIAQRKKDPHAAEKKDLLSSMLQGVDPVTGAGLSDTNIRFQMNTFLIAGHETTSGLLSFTMFYLLDNPHVLAKARDEVDRVLGNNRPTFEHIRHFKYIEQVLKESLRLWPTAPAFARTPFEDTVIGDGKYKIAKDTICLVLVPQLHRDPAVWENPEVFDPERFSEENEDKIPPNAFKPFGAGQRACIGRGFAMQEAMLVIAMILQKFDLELHDPTYKLKLKQTLTLKPLDFFIRAKKRSTVPRTGMTPTPVPSDIPVSSPLATTTPNPTGTTPLLVLYGSNSGSAQSFAQRIASDARQNGFVSTIDSLDQRVGQLPAEGAVIVVTASYEGQPPDNARTFVPWVESLKNSELQGVRYAVFGCGNRDWMRTYQAVPKRVDAAMETGGATRLMPRGEADARADFFGDFEAWYRTLWPTLSAAFGQFVAHTTNASRGLEVELVKETKAARLGHGELMPGLVIENRELVDLTSPVGRSKRHIEIQLPQEMKYRTGDYLAVLPTNPVATVDRALTRYGFDRESQIIIKASADNRSDLPTGYPISVAELLTNYVELAQPATRVHLDTMIAATVNLTEQAALRELSVGDRFLTEVIEKRMSVLELLERSPSCQLPFSVFLTMLPPMRARQYSISSSPLWKTDHVTLTVAVVDAPARSGQGRYLGAASNYLALAQPGTRLSVAVRPSNVAFHLPEQPAAAETPLIMICAGTGIAPFRGFIQERALQLARGEKLATALLFFGVCDEHVDYLYGEELKQWEAAGAVELHPVFSRAGSEIKYVQHRLYEDRATVCELMQQNCKVFVCGDAQRIMPALRLMAAQIYREAHSCSAEDADKWVIELEQNRSRFFADVFA